MHLEDRDKGDGRGRDHDPHDVAAVEERVWVRKNLRERNESQRPLPFPGKYGTQNVLKALT